MDHVGENLERFDETRPGPVEELIAIRGVNAPVAHGA